MSTSSPVSVFKGEFSDTNSRYKGKTVEYIFNDWLLALKENIYSFITSNKLPNIPKQLQSFEGHDMHLIDAKKRLLTIYNNDVPISCYIQYKKINEVNNFNIQFNISTCRNNDRTMLSYNARCTELSQKVTRATESEFIDKIIDVINYFKEKYKALKIFTNNMNEYLMIVNNYIVSLKFVSKLDIYTNAYIIYQTLSLDMSYCHLHNLDNIPHISRDKNWSMIYNSSKDVKKQAATYTYLQIKNEFQIPIPKTKTIPKKVPQKNTIKCDLIVEARALGMTGYSKYRKDELARKIKEFRTRITTHV